MSLIDEALKRARLEAAQKAAEGEGLPYPTIPRHLGPQRRRAWLAPVGVALAVVTGAVVGLLLASRGGPAAERLAARRAEVGSSSASSPPAAAESPADQEAATNRVRPEPISPAPAPETATSSPSLSPRSSSPPAADPQPPMAPAVQPAVAAPSPAAVPPPQATMTVTDPDSGVLLVLPERATPGVADSATDAVSESYVQQYPLPNGSAIELGGIAWSETGPFALINGRVVGPGSMIEDYTLERIRPGHVVLTGAGRRIRLSLR